MSTSENNFILRIGKRYGCATIGCVIFSAVYEAFSHGVLSWWMMLLGAWPFLLGTVPFLIFFKKGRILVPRRGISAYHCGVITLTVGSCMTGVFEIYGSSCEYSMVYWLAGGLMILIGIIGMLINGRLKA